MKPIINILIVLVVFIGIIYIYRKRKNTYDNVAPEVAPDVAPEPGLAPSPVPTDLTPAPAPAPAPAPRRNPKFMSNMEKALEILKFFEENTKPDEKPDYLKYIELIDELDISEQLKLKSIFYEFIDLYKTKELSLGLILDRGKVTF